MILEERLRLFFGRVLCGRRSRMMAELIKNGLGLIILIGIIVTIALSSFLSSCENALIEMFLMCQVLCLIKQLLVVQLRV